MFSYKFWMAGRVGSRSEGENKRGGGVGGWSRRGRIKGVEGWWGGGGV